MSEKDDKMAVHRSKTSAAKDDPEPPAADDPIVVSSVAPTKQATGDLDEYETEDGATYLLTAEEAERRGAKAVSKPSNKAQTPQNK
jgi:hypothetical protein